MLLDPTKVRVVTLGSEEFLQLEAARRGKKRLYYTAKGGDTLVKLGRRYGLTPGDLARINRFSYNTELHEGDRVVVYSPTGDAPHERPLGAMGMTPGSKRPERGAPPAAHAPDATAKRKPAAAVAKVDVKPVSASAAKSAAKPAPKASDKAIKQSKAPDKAAAAKAGGKKT
jgi:membrane-bound lytic murein transglycosylase D